MGNEHIRVLRRMAVLEIGALQSDRHFTKTVRSQGRAGPGFIQIKFIIPPVPQELSDFLLKYGKGERFSSELLF